MPIATTKEYKIKFSEQGAAKVQSATQKLGMTFNKLGTLIGITFGAATVAAIGKFAVETAKMTTNGKAAFDKFDKSVENLKLTIGSFTEGPVVKGIEILTNLIDKITGHFSVQGQIDETVGYINKLAATLKRLQDQQDAAKGTWLEALAPKDNNIEAVRNQIRELVLHVADLTQKLPKVTTEVSNIAIAYKSLHIEGLQPVIRATDDWLMKLKEIRVASLNVIPEAVDAWDIFRTKISETTSTLESEFLGAFRNGENLFKAFGDAFVTMLERMVAELLAKAAIFALLSAFGLTGPAGLSGGFKGLGQFILGGYGVTGPLGSPANGGGGSLNKSVGGGGNIVINAIDANSFENYLRFRGGAQAIQRVLPEVL